MLRTVSFEVVSGDVLTVTPHVDGVSLAALIEAYEGAKGYVDPAGGYGGLIPDYFDYGRLDQYLLGRSKSDYWVRLHGIYLLGCECGEVGCWPLIARVHQEGNTIRWDGFVQPFRAERDYSEFGPFEFAQAQYGDALKDLLIRLTSVGATSPT